MNFIIICSSMLCILGGKSVSDYLVFMPDHIVRQRDAKDASQSSSFPYFWTFFTSIFIEESLLIMLGELMVINYIVYKNRKSFENAW